MDDDRSLPPATRTVHWARGDGGDHTPLLNLEWLVTNGVGGYASGTVAGVITRRYHGYLVAALPVHGRTVTLHQLTEEVRLPGERVRLGGEERSDALEIHAANLAEFRLELGLPVWRYEFGPVVLEKRVLMPHGQNTAMVSYRLLRGLGRIRLRLFPWIAFRPHDAPLEQHGKREYTVQTSGDNRYEVHTAGFPPLRLKLGGANAAMTLDWRGLTELQHRVEAARGYPSVGTLLRPGHWSVELSPSSPEATLVVSTEDWDTALTMTPAQATQAEFERRRRLIDQAPAAVREGRLAELVLAADQFIVTPRWRVHELTRGDASGVRNRSIIAGYHWFTDWGRDTMIALEGLTLATGRAIEAREILWTFAQYVRDGLIPNLFPEGREEGLYHTADATLWFFHAVHRYVTATGDRMLARQLLPRFLSIVEAHLKGTRFGIGVDPADGLLRQGAPGYALTWMDAKVGDWVVTPRRGKSVEINALWFNALKLCEGWARECGQEQDAATLAGHAGRARASFNARFWNPATQYLFDIVDGEQGDDPACRPNQVFAIGLDHPVLDRERWAPVMREVEARLLTPYGLRSLAPDHPDYKRQYFGDLKARDAAYHQGTVWGWLIGPYVDAWKRLHPDEPAGSRKLLEGLLAHVGDAGLGSISEIFDAEAPYTPRGCIAQAWSVAEVLRLAASGSAARPDAS